MIIVRFWCWWAELSVQTEQVPSGSLCCTCHHHLPINRTINACIYIVWHSSGEEQGNCYHIVFCLDIEGGIHVPDLEARMLSVPPMNSLRGCKTIYGAPCDRWADITRLIERACWGTYCTEGIATSLDLEWPTPRKDSWKLPVGWGLRNKPVAWAVQQSLKVCSHSRLARRMAGELEDSSHCDICNCSY